jgi:hypothetical protein
VGPIRLTAHSRDLAYASTVTQLFRADRPYMPGYGIVPAAEGSGLLAWAWAEDRLAQSHDYWMATVDDAGRPHVMPVWGIWRGEALWFSSSRASRKARNLRANASCTATTDNPLEPVIVRGTAGEVTTDDGLRVFVDAVNAKYGTAYGLDFFSEGSAVFALAATWVFALDTADFTGSPTRWRRAGDR